MFIVAPVKFDGNLSVLSTNSVGNAPPLLSISSPMQYKENQLKVPRILTTEDCANDSFKNECTFI